MSRYTLELRTNIDSNTRVAIGWDRPLKTFFAHVTLLGAEDDDIDVDIVYRGTHPDDLATADMAIRLVHLYAVVPHNLSATLETDRLKTLGTSDTPLQRNMKRRFL